MKRVWQLIAGVLVLAGPAQALEVSNAAYYRLMEGSVTQGRGVVFDVLQGVYIEGTWSGGRTIPGEVYQVSHPSARAKKYEITFGVDGFPAKGTQLRGLGNIGKVVPFYQGTFKKMYHPFMRGEVGVLHEGVYDTGLGIEYRGVFEYMPAKGMMTGAVTTGYFIFYGDKVDREEETKETGLYVSENTPAGTPIRFSQADPSYLTVLQQQYQQDMQIAAGDFKKERVRQNWVKAFAVLYEVSQVMNGGGLAGEGGRNQFAINLVKGALTQSSNEEKPDGLKELALKSLVGAGVDKLVENKELSDKLTQAITTGLEKAAAKDAVPVQ